MAEPRRIVYVIDCEISSLETTTKLLRDLDLRVYSYLSCSEFLAACTYGMQGCVLLNTASAPPSSVQELERGLLERTISLPIIVHAVNVNKLASSQATWSAALDVIRTTNTVNKLLNQVRDFIKTECPVSASSPAILITRIHD